MSAATGFSLAPRLRAGETVFTAWCGLASPVVVETIVREGFVSAVLDAQHGLVDLASAIAAIGAARLGGAAPVVRIPLGDFGGASRALDFGAEGIIAPMINTVADARALVSATKFPPVGDRSWGPHRAMALGGIADPAVYLRDANTLTLTFAMIETREALRNVDAIAAVDGIDALFVGPSDLSIALSDGAVVDAHSPAVEAELDRVVQAAKKAGKIPGLYCANAERAKDGARRGFRFLAVGSDLIFLRMGTAAQVKALKAG
jgi:4-hydroxy-2-oxoheptanedioate aldolase